MAALLERARTSLGPNAAVVAVRRTASGFELDAADSATHATRVRLDAARHERRARGSDRPRVVALVGPTGAGKTTTLAKLTNHPGAFGDFRVGLLCLDTYRVGAVEQIGIYAELSKVPLEVAYDAADADRALHRLADCEVVLVDTAGRGPRAERDRAAIHNQLLRLLPDETHLCLPAGWNPALARRVTAQHRALGVTHVLPTKRDECPEDETAFQLAKEFALDVRWWTDGQEVPADLCFADTGARGARVPAFTLEGAGV
jgi:flagellar biosynthesis protein FlhF